MVSQLEIRDCGLEFRGLKNDRGGGRGGQQCHGEVRAEEGGTEGPWEELRPTGETQLLACETFWRPRVQRMGWPVGERREARMGPQWPCLPPATRAWKGRCRIPLSGNLGTELPVTSSHGWQGSLEKVPEEEVHEPTLLAWGTALGALA